MEGIRGRAAEVAYNCWVEVQFPSPVEVKAIRVAPLSPASSSYTPAGPQALDGAELLHSLDGYQWEVVQQLVPFADTRLSTETRIVMETDDLDPLASRLHRDKRPFLALWKKRYSMPRASDPGGCHDAG